MVGWWAIFFLLGGPALPVHRAAATLFSALLVSTTWPMSLTQWCGVLGASLEAEQQHSNVTLTSVVDFYLCTPVDGVRKADDVERTAHATTLSTKSAAGGVNKRGGAAPSLIESSSESTRCFVLAAVLLCGGLFGQLDWQVPYQVWPYPSLLVYGVVRSAFWVADCWS